MTHAPRPVPVLRPAPMSATVSYTDVGRGHRRNWPPTLEERNGPGNLVKIAASELVDVIRATLEVGTGPGQFAIELAGEARG